MQKGVDEIGWLTDRPNRYEGLWKLVRRWFSLFETSDPNTHASFKIGNARELMAFEMFKPKYDTKKRRLAFKLHAGFIKAGRDIITGLKGKTLSEPKKILMMR